VCLDGIAFSRPSPSSGRGGLHVGQATRNAAHQGHGDPNWGGGVGRGRKKRGGDLRRPPGRSGDNGGGQRKRSAGKSLPDAIRTSWKPQSPAERAGSRADVRKNIVDGPT